MKFHVISANASKVDFEKEIEEFVNKVGAENILDVQMNTTTVAPCEMIHFYSALIQYKE